MCVAGARPNFMKIAPVLHALERRDERVILVHTGQHYDPSMSDVFFEELNIRAPDRHLEVGSGTHAEQTARVMTEFEPVVDAEQPDLVVVVGDVNSTLAAAIVAAKAGCRVAHVEAGLRSRDWTMPEEINRVATDRVSDYLFAPSPDAVTNLQAEGYRDDQIHLVGNVMVDTLLLNRARALARAPHRRLGLPDRYGVVTLHRPATVDDPEILARVLAALGDLARDLPLVFPMHPRAELAMKGLEKPDGLIVTTPLGYLDFLGLEAGAALVLTDSGGVQEETTALGVPCLTIRENTERPITVSEGTNTVVGRDRDRILAEACRLLREGVEPRCPSLWDGKAGERIADVLLSTQSVGRPTDLP